jgi:uncharacterized protein (TIGR00288 family)
MVIENSKSLSQPRRGGHGTDGERSLAIFIDFENLALGFQGRRDRFDISRVLERLVEKGKIVAKKAYADWSRFQQFTQALHESAIELIEIPRRAQSGKNSADIRLCVDAMDLAYSKEHIDTFVVLSGDSDFSPLVSKLKELGKHVIGLGMQDSTSDLLRDNCDEFIYYEDLGQETGLAPEMDKHIPETKRKAFALLLESLLALRRENKEVLWSSMIKDTMKRKKPSFNEAYHGYRTFSELLEDAKREGLLELDTDKRSRTYVVTRFGADNQPSGESIVEPVPEGTPAVVKKKSRRRRSGKRRPVNGGAAVAVAPAENVPSTPTAPPEEMLPTVQEGQLQGDSASAATETTPSAPPGELVPARKGRSRRRGRGSRAAGAAAAEKTSASPRSVPTPVGRAATTKKQPDADSLFSGLTPGHE